MDSLSIRNALITLANSNSRPHYTAMVVRDVLNAFRTGAEHFLKNDVVALVGQIQPIAEVVADQDNFQDKTCTHCKESYPATKQFFFGRTTSDGFRFDQICKACYKQKYNRSKIRSNNIDYRYAGGGA